MRTTNMIKRVLLVCIFGLFLTSSNTLLAQCRTDLNLGENLVVNGDFSSGYSGWAFDAPYKIKGAGNSNPTDLQIGTNPATFNTGGGGFPPFDTYGDHTTGSGNFLMVDGYCSASSTVRVWSQTVNVMPNTNYYFSVWISSLKNMPTNPGNLNFNIGGSDLGSNILAPTFGGATASNGTNSGGGWIRYVIVWNSGATSGAVPLSIQNNNTSACGSEVDFGLDDIAFTPGCDFGVPGPKPDLGPDQSLCGKGGSITLNANVPMNATTTITWSDGTTNTGANPAFYSKVITAPGVYSVCASDNGSCTKSDVIVISNTFTPNTTPGANLCTSSSVPLDAVFTGIGTTYQWKLNGVNLPNPSTNRTYTATTAGNYTVDVTVPGCGTVSSGTTAITTSSTITPIDAYYCATSGPASVTLGATGTNSANIGWYTASTGGSPIASGVTTPNATTSQYAAPTIPMGTTATQTYYVQDETVSTGTVGPTTFSSVNNSTMPTTTNYLQFAPGGDFTINSLKIPFVFYNPAARFTVTLEVTRADGTSFSPAKTFTSGLSVETPVNDGVTRLFTLPFTGFVIDKTWGTTLGLKLTARSFTFEGQIMIGTNGGAYPYNSTIPGVVSIPNSIVGGAVNTTGYSFFYNWNISAKSICARTPVRAISNCVTPVTWTSFYLIPQNNSCKLVWSTADETNNSYFAVERSVDGINFEAIATVSGAGNRDIASNYFYVDNAALPGTSYYRITQYDYDGKFSSTSMRPYSSEGLVEVTTYPNPFHNSTTLLVSGADTETYTYTVYSVNGQLIEQGSGTMNHAQTIGEAHAKGMYMLTVLTSTDIITTKIVKQ